MIDPIQVFFSNQTEVLYEHLKMQLLNSFSLKPFSKRMVIVPSAAMQNWLMLRLANDLGVATGIEFIPVHRAFHRILEVCHPSPPYFPNSIELSFAIELELKEIKKNFSHLPSSEKSAWQPIARYLMDKSESRLIHFSQHLGESLYLYGRAYDTIPSKGWQNRLIPLIYSKNPSWKLLSTAYLDPIVVKSDVELHFFGISDLNRAEYDYLLRLGSHIPLYNYVFSPSMMFWADIRSDRERSALLSFWQKHKVASNKLMTLNQLLEERNPLVGNWGRWGRTFVEYLEEDISHIQAHYRLPITTKAPEEFEFEENLFFYESNNNSLTLLHAIQADLVFLRNPEERPPVSLLSEDDSLQIHSASNKRREVEALYQTLIGLLDKKSGELTPKDIIVLSPQLNEYIPYIQSVFSKKESQLDYHFSEDHSLAHEELFQGFTDLIALGQSRWDTLHLLRLFSHPAFQRRHKIACEDFQRIEQWIKKSEITWGMDSNHQQEIFQRDHYKEKMVNEKSVITWRVGLEKIELYLKACGGTSEITLFNRFKDLVDSLYKDLNPLQKRTQLSLKEWMSYLQSIFDSYLACHPNQPQSIESHEFIHHQFKYLENLNRHYKQELFTFESIYSPLRQLLQSKKQTFPENISQTILFGSLADFKSVPSKVIAIIGMDEGAFPKSSTKAEPFLEEERKKSSSADEDRYLFLEALHSAREHLLLFYSLQSRAENRDESLSPVVEELLAYCDKFYTLDGNPPSNHCIVNHSFESYSLKNFQNSLPLNNYSHADFKKALILSEPKKSLPTLLNEFEKPSLQKQHYTGSTLSIQELLRASKNPIKLHLNQSVGVFFTDEEAHRYKIDEKLQLSSLDKYAIREKSLRAPINLILKEQQMSLPLGVFKSVATLDAKEEANAIQAKLTKHDIKSTDLFSIEFSVDSLEPKQIDSSLWSFPAPEIILEGHKPIRITGKISHLSSKGLILLDKGSSNTIWKNWPTLLMFCYAAQLYSELMESQIIFMQSAKTVPITLKDPLTLLSYWTRYYSICLNQFSPLIPEWIPFIINQDSAGLKKQQEKIFSDFSSSFIYQELRWLLDKSHLPCTEKLIEDWSEWALLLGGVEI